MRPLAFLLFALPALAADVALKPVYLQTVPHSQVLVDRRGKAWFVDESGVRDANNKLACDATDGRLLLVDKAGRFWFHGLPKGKAWQLRYHDGKGWTDTGVQAMEAHEDAAGRVVARTEFGFQVFDDGKWTETKLFDYRMQAHGYYTDDPAGRVWCMIHIAGAGRPQHLWAFDGKTWTEHDPLKRGKDELYTEVVPFADDWFLVAKISTKDNLPAPRTWAVWSPTRTADQIARADKLAALPRTGLTYTGPDADGLQHFSRTQVHDGKRWVPATSFAVSSDGTVKELTADEAVRWKAQPGARWSGQPRHFASLADPVPAVHLDPGSAACRDSDGRVYFTSYTRNRVGAVVLWAKHETPTACLRPTTYTVDRYEKVLMPGLFADADAFALHPQHLDGVLTWDGKAEKWAETPIKPLPLSVWNHHVDAPPAEHSWANVRAVGHATGADGLTLFTRVKTKYAPERDGGGVILRGGGRAVREEREEKPKPPDGPLYQYEAWLHAGGDWSKPLPPAELIKLKRKELLAGFTRPATPFGPLPVISHAGRVWFAHEWKVTAMDADGATHSAELPMPAARKPKNQWDNPPPRPLMLAAFARKGDKSLVAVVSGGDPNGAKSSAYELRFQAGKLATVKVSELTDLPLGVPTLHTTPDGTVLAWEPRHEGVFALVGDTWEKVAGAGRVVARTADGAVWCEPARGPDADWLKGSTVLLRVGGAKAERFVWTPDEWQIGFEKPPAGSVVFLLAQVGVGCLEPGKPGAKPTLRVRYTPSLRSIEFPATQTLTPTGHLLMAHEWVRLFDPSR